MAFRSIHRPVVAASLFLIPLALACGSDSSREPGATPFEGQTPGGPSAMPPGNAGSAEPQPLEPTAPGAGAVTPGMAAGNEANPNPTGLTGTEAQPPAGGSTPATGSDTQPPTEMQTPGNVTPLGTIEDSGTACAQPALPAPNQLQAFATHPDPFLMTNGTRITTKAQWECRRAEIKAQVEQYESGPKPAVDPANVTGRFANNQLTVGVTDQGKNVSFSITINRPAGAAAGPIPLLIGVGGSSLDNTVFSENGVALATLDNNAMGAQAGGTSRGTGTFYDLYGNTHPASSMIAWAWGVSRVIDALEKTPDANVDPKRIAITGCSRNGKGALTAGAFDERVALTIPQESGAGGSASWRVSQTASNNGENVQTLSSAANEQPWFRANFGTNFSNGNVTKLPFDHHMVMGLVAPRPLLVIDNQIDWLGIDSSFTDGSIAHQIWGALGVADQMGYWQTAAHNHCAFPAAQRNALAAYVKKFLVGTGTDDTNLLRGDAAKADLATWMKWTAPTLE